MQEKLSAEFRGSHRVSPNKAFFSESRWLRRRSAEKPLLFLQGLHCKEFNEHAVSISLRQRFFADCTAFRVSHFEHDPHLTVDYYGGHLLFTYYEGCEAARLPKLTDEIASQLRGLALPVYGGVKKFRPQNLSHANKSDDARAQPLFGEMPPEKFVVQEYDLKFLVSFHAGFATGLFLDIKRARRRVRQLVKPGDEVLNLFSYTGAFSIAAAKAGAARVIEVDSSGRWLRWARENQTLNAVTTVRQRKEDALKFLHKQKDANYDFIICDPPTYSSQKSGARFTVAQGFEAMLPDFHRALRPNGLLLASTNYIELTRAKFFKLFSPKFILQEEIAISEDFNGDDYLKVGLFRKA